MGLPAREIAPLSGPQVKKLKKGEALFQEGDISRAMFVVKSGMIRVYKRKGAADIELDTIRAGQVIGELAFLDGNPRSASAQALVDCELVEISGPVFQESLQKVPDWLKMLLKTVVGRLRAASTRIRQLESSSTAFDYSTDGKRAANYVYLSPTDVLKVLSGLLLVGAKNGVELCMGLLQRYCNQIMGIPMAKLTSVMDILTTTGWITETQQENGEVKTTFKDLQFLENAIAYLNEENLIDPSKRHDLSPRGFLIMEMMSRHLHRYPKDPLNSISKVNVAEIRRLETPEDSTKEPFRMEECGELTKLGYMSNVNIKSNDEVYAALNPDLFLRAFYFQQIAVGIAALNEEKRKGGK